MNAEGRILTAARWISGANGTLGGAAGTTGLGYGKWQRATEANRAVEYAIQGRGHGTRRSSEPAAQQPGTGLPPATARRGRRDASNTPINIGTNRHRQILFPRLLPRRPGRTSEPSRDDPGILGDRTTDRQTARN